mmetsp:Transcript_20782/g.35526  ORF Transcript_20782/g.35526 Transcript_20782/m.35526 type:complete len:448 (+) Transcript_20782:88-1431(+)
MLHAGGMALKSFSSPCAVGSAAAGAPRQPVACSSQRRSSHRPKDERPSNVYHLLPTSAAALSEGTASDPRPVAQQRQDLSMETLSASISARLQLERLWHLGSVEQPAPLSSCPTTLMPQSPQLVHRASSPPPPTEERTQKNRNSERTPDYFANVGDCIRTLREDVPQLFSKDLNYSIYRDDIVFCDPRNKFEGIKNYKTIFWSLRFHGKIFFSKLFVEVKRIWQPTDDVIKIRWTVRGTPRVPWEAQGLFDGISTYKLDREGRIYEHSVDNIMLIGPPMISVSLLSGFNLAGYGQPQQQQQPVPGAWCSAESHEEFTPLHLDASAPTSQFLHANQTVPPWMEPALPPPQIYSALSHSTSPFHSHFSTHCSTCPATHQVSSTAQEGEGAVDQGQQGHSGEGMPLPQPGLQHFSWVRLYAALWASVALLGLGGVGARDNDNIAAGAGHC